MFRCPIPEGVEIKISAELIKPLVINKNILNLKAGSNSRYKNNPPEGLEDFIKDISSWRIPMRITDISVKGKFMYWTFTNDSGNEDWHMFCTFGMTGQWSPKEGNHPCFIFEFSDHPYDVYFNDPRHFGTIKFVQGRQKLLEKLNEFGWDPLANGITDVWTRYVIGMCARTTKPIGQLLMDQSVFAGVGNYIRAEALYLAKISPWRQCNLMTQDDIKTLCQAVVDVMNDSYKHQGATILTYKDAYGAEGKYSSCFKVYGQKEDPLGNKIIKEDTPDKRTIHWCPAIQV